jgi:hypothetical protein
MAILSLSAAMAEIKANPGKVYVYVLSRPDGSPFYVGVGSGRRLRHHERSTSAKDARTAKAKMVRDILAAGCSVGYEIAGWFDDWDSGAKEERRLIALHGRADLSRGPLTNRTNGGQGGWFETAARTEGVRRAAEKNRGRKHSAEHRARISAAGRGRKQSADHVRKRADAKRGSIHSPESRVKMAKAATGRVMPQETRDALARWRAENPDRMAEARKLGAEKLRALWREPDFITQMAARPHRTFRPR